MKPPAGFFTSPAFFFLIFDQTGGGRRNCRVFLSWIHNCLEDSGGLLKLGGAFQVDLKKHLGRWATPKKMGKSSGDPNQRRKNFTHLLPSLNTNGWNLKIPYLKKGGLWIQTTKCWVPAVQFSGVYSGVSLFRRFVGGLGPFSTFWIAGHSDGTCSGMGRATLRWRWDICG